VSTRPSSLDHLPLLNPAEFPDCFVCGVDNPHGFHLRVHQDGSDAVARYEPTPHQEGYPGRFHGGLVGLLVDEMLVYAGAPHGLWGMTAKVQYRLRRAIAFDGPLDLRARLTQKSDRGFRAKVTIHGPDGALAAEGEGTCVLVPGTGE
jgi:acyl-coenzyme A thioesterase PaaI-like protein